VILLAAADPRELAREILHERRFHRASLPQPLRKPLHELGNLFDGAGRTLQRGVEAINGAIPGGAWLVWALLAGLVAWVTVKLVHAHVARSRRGGAHDDAGASTGRGPSPRDLERDAGDAERAGRFADALRLRFRAGLLTLAQRGVIERRPSLRSAEVSSALHSERFDALAQSFDEVVYGGRDADEQDAVEAREGWRDVLAQERA
jgi:hypothetical protein